MRGPERKYPFAPADEVMFRCYDSSSEAVSFLVDYFSKKWGIEVPRYVITHQAKLFRKHRPHRWWTTTELAYLSKNYGLLSDEKICAVLKRTRNAIVLAAKRHLQISRKLNFYTAHDVAYLLGVKCSKIISITWRVKGYLEITKSPVGCGPGNTCWMVKEPDLVAALERRPWLASIDRMAPGQYRALVKREWERDPWYTAEQAAELIGVMGTYVSRYIRRGWLKAERMAGGPHQGKWIVRRSAIAAFLANDPRPELHRRRVLLSKDVKRLERGLPVIHYTMWIAICPKCGRIVHVIAPPRLYAPQVLEQMNGQRRCKHGEIVNLLEAGVAIPKEAYEKKSAAQPGDN